MKPSAQTSRDRPKEARHLWFQHGTAHFAVRLAELVEVGSLSIMRPPAFAEPSLLGFGLFRGEVLPVFDPLSLAGLPGVPVSNPVQVAVTAVHNRPTLALAMTRVGEMVDLSEANLVSAGGRIAAAFLGKQTLRDEPLLVLDVGGLAYAMELDVSLPGEPSALEASTRNRPVATTSNTASEESGHRMRLMIVDDHATARGVIREVVGPLAGEVRECADGTEAVRTYPEFRPDFVTMDLQMRPMNGLDAMRRILAFHPSARVIVVSQANSPVVRESVLRFGACHFVSKDDLSELRRYLARP